MRTVLHVRIAVQGDGPTATGAAWAMLALWLNGTDRNRFRDGDLLWYAVAVTDETQDVYQPGITQP